MIKTLFAPAALAAVLATAGLPAQAVTFLGATGGLVTDFSAAGALAFELDLSGYDPVTLTYQVEAADLGAPIDFSAFILVPAGTGTTQLTLTLGGATFGTVGSVVRPFGGSASTDVTGGPAVIGFDSFEFFGAEVGDFFLTTPGVQHWLLAEGGLAEGSVFTVTAVAAIPEPSTYALMAAGLGVIGWLGARRRRQG